MSNERSRRVSYSSRMKILVLGDSDTSGRFSGGRSWPQLLLSMLEAERKEHVELTSVGLSVVNESGAPYVARRVEEVNPDVVVLVLGSLGFTAKFTWLGVQRVFGKRAGRWYRRIEEGFDAGTRDGTGKPQRINVAARWFATRFVPKRAYSTRPIVTERYREIFRTLSRSEDMQVVIMGYPGTGRHARIGNAPRERALFFAELQGVAEGLHFRWVDTTALFSDHLERATKVDDLHFNSEGHERIASAIGKAIRAGALTAS